MISESKIDFDKCRFCKKKYARQKIFVSKHCWLHLKSCNLNLYLQKNCFIEHVISLGKTSNIQVEKFNSVLDNLTGSKSEMT